MFSSNIGIKKFILIFISMKDEKHLQLWVNKSVFALKKSIINLIIK
jgi:hypothetical protein